MKNQGKYHSSRSAEQEKNWIKQSLSSKLHVKTKTQTILAHHSAPFKGKVEEIDEIKNSNSFL